MKLLLKGKKVLLGGNREFKMKGLSRKQYSFEYNSDLQAFVYDANTQEEVNDIFEASFKLYRHFKFVPLFDEVKEEKPKAKAKAKAKEADHHFVKEAELQSLET